MPPTAADCDAIAAIYDHHARTRTATFDLEGHSPAVWAERIAKCEAHGWPFLVADRDGRILGFAYATQFRDRPAYAASCEDSIYIDKDAMGMGVGRALLEALIESARASGFEQMLAVIGNGEPGSVAVHGRCGFVERGRMIGVGRKFGRTLDTVYMQRAL